MGNYFEDYGAQSTSQTPQSGNYFENYGHEQTPDNVTQAQNLIGSQDYNQLCERFAEAVTKGKTGVYPSATDAWLDYSKQGKAKQGIDGLKKGDLIYWYNPADSDGHVSVYIGGDTMIGATDTEGIKQTNINNWAKDTGEQILGHVPYEVAKGN